jgi:hypothetical protein
MPFDVPTRPAFDAALWAENKVLKLNQREVSVFGEFIGDYQSFWEVSGADKTETIDGVEVTTFVGGGSRHTVEEMQAILDSIGTAGFVAVATASSKMIAYIEDNGGTVPDRYKTAAFEYTIGPSGIVLTKLADVWAVPVV